jgi:RNA polymerase sigma-70 factor (ECF subfamily)
MLKLARTGTCAPYRIGEKHGQPAKSARKSGFSIPNRAVARLTWITGHFDGLDRPQRRSVVVEGGGNHVRADHERRDAFARLFAQHDRWLFAYLVSLLGNPAHAEEVFQEVCVVLWREYETFQLGTDFVKWVSVIAHNQVHRFRRQQRRVGSQLSDAAVDLLAQDAVERASLLESRRDALRHCLEKLPRKDRQLVQQCYCDSRVTFKRVAEALGRPVNTVYKALNRIRKALYECIERTLAVESAR